ncbi:MAG TPA: DCC1-like thiol-disulfide oxidoreductase family protein [Candidatus Thermoplasmatota archaeon]|nr:DCC1-like thiol-disulfide oxidoreductase family protein [Candidatus Thermoplasmatota archaeon]
MTPATPRAADEAIVLFDGGCAFCSRGVRFLHARDPAGRLRYAPLEGPAGIRLRAEHGVRGTGSLVLVEDGVAHVRSTAALRAALRLRAPWPWLARAGLLVPRPLRDAVYDAVARRRHRLARGEACPVPPPSLRARMLE